MGAGLQPGPASALFEVFIFTCCFWGDAFIVFSLLGQNSWIKLVQQRGACFVSQLEGTALCGREVGRRAELETTSSTATSVGKQRENEHWCSLYIFPL